MIQSVLAGSVVNQGDFHFSGENIQSEHMLVHEHTSFSSCIWILFCACGWHAHSHIGSQYMVSCLYTVLAVERVGEEDVASGVYNFPAHLNNINGNPPIILLLHYMTRLDGWESLFQHNIIVTTSFFLHYTLNKDILHQVYLTISFGMIWDNNLVH